MSQKLRDPYWDNVKGILILITVIAHFIPPTAGTINGAIYEGIYLFHMPLFIFVSGIFYKDHGVKERCLGLVLIGLSYNILLIVLDNLCLKYEQTFYLFRATKIPWFVWTIALCTLIVYMMRNCNPLMVLLISMVVSVIACYDQELMNYMVLAKTCCWFPFFYLGYIIKRERMKEIIDKVPVCIGGYEYFKRSKI